MFRFHVLVLLAVSPSIAMLAQTENQADKYEFFAGYSLEHIAPGCGSNYRCGSVSPGPTTNFNGAAVALTGYVYKSLGITGQITGNFYGTAALSSEAVHRYTYQVGPAYTFRFQRASAFAHALFGGVTEPSMDPPLHYTRFLWSVGGGLDVKVSRGLSIRPVQFDYEKQQVPVFGSPDTSSSGFRYSAGIVLKF